MGKENLVYGRKVIREVINSTININKLYISESINRDNIKDIIKHCEENDILIKYMKPFDMDSLCDNNVHQGVACKIDEYKYLKFKDFLNNLDNLCEKEKSPFVLILDGIQDPRNLGSILRTSEGLNIKNIIIPQRHSSGITNVVWKTSMGAVCNLNICRINNLSYAIKSLKERNFKIVGTTFNTDSYLQDHEYDFPIALIIGNEENGISKELMELCDIRIKIPMLGRINSFNVSVASGIIMYTIKKIRREF